MLQEIWRAVRQVFCKFESTRDDQHGSANFEIQVQLERDDVDGGWIATCVDLPGCVSQGDTPKEALENLVDAISGVLAVRMQEKLPELQDEGPNKRYKVAISA